MPTNLQTHGSRFWRYRNATNCISWRRFRRAHRKRLKAYSPCPCRPCFGHTLVTQTLKSLDISQFFADYRGIKTAGNPRNIRLSWIERCPPKAEVRGSNLPERATYRIDTRRTHSVWTCSHHRGRANGRTL